MQKGKNDSNRNGNQTMRVRPDFPSDESKPSEVSRESLQWYAGAWRTPEAIERKRQSQRESVHRRYHSDEAYREKVRLRQRVSSEAQRENRNRKKREQYQLKKREQNAKRIERARKNRDKQNAYQREWWARNKNRELAKLKNRKDFRNPARVVRRLTKEFNEGSVGLDEFTQKVSATIGDFNERVSETFGLGTKRAGREKG